MNRWDLPSSFQLTVPSAHSLQLSLVITLFLDQALYLNDLGSSRGNEKALAVPPGPLLTSAESSLHAKVAHLGETYSEPLLSHPTHFLFLETGGVI